MKLIIAGGRDFRDEDKMRLSLTKIYIPRNGKPEAIVCGLAPGADSLGYKVGTSLEIPILKFPADWNKYGRGAGPIRNEEMAKAGTHLLLFWDGKSAGSRDMFERAAQHDLPTTVVWYNTPDNKPILSICPVCGRPGGKVITRPGKSACEACRIYWDPESEASWYRSRAQNYTRVKPYLSL